MPEAVIRFFGQPVKVACDGLRRASVKQEKRISMTLEQYDGDWPPSDASGFVAWFKAKLSYVPEDSRDTACIKLDSTMRYDSSYATIEFSYTRMETDAEEAERERQAAAQAERRRAQELRMLADLQAKYGAPKT